MEITSKVKNVSKEYVGRPVRIILHTWYLCMESPGYEQLLGLIFNIMSNAQYID